MKYPLVITEDHVQAGIPLDSNRCPVALALLAHFKNLKNVSVGIEDFFFFMTNDGNPSFMRPIPYPLAQFIRAVDRDKSTVKPATFELNFVLPDCIEEVVCDS